MNKDMSGLIEQAAHRMAQLREAGVDLPETPLPVQAERPAAHTRASLLPEPLPPAMLSRRIEIDLEALASAGIVSPNAPRSQIADQFRVIKRPLLANAQGKGAATVEKGNLIVVTSSLPGEGKTFTAINLALSIAMEVDCTVMLVDADVGCPSVMRVLGLPPGPGLLDMVQDESLNMSDFLLRTNIDKLTLLPSGTPHPRATELLASDAMTRLLDDMARRYPDRIIVFDSPPLLLATESQALASHMGQVVMVVQAEKTPQAKVIQALSTIESCPVKLMLLNQARTASTSGYGYGYGYSSEPQLA